MAAILPPPPGGKETYSRSPAPTTTRRPENTPVPRPKPKPTRGPERSSAAPHATPIFKGPIKTALSSPKTSAPGRGQAPTIPNAHRPFGPSPWAAAKRRPNLTLVKGGKGDVLDEREFLGDILNGDIATTLTSAATTVVSGSPIMAALTGVIGRIGKLFKGKAGTVDFNERADAIAGVPYEACFDVLKRIANKQFLVNYWTTRKAIRAANAADNGWKGRHMSNALGSYDELDRAHPDPTKDDGPDYWEVGWRYAMIYPKWAVSNSPIDRPEWQMDAVKGRYFGAFRTAVIGAGVPEALWDQIAQYVWNGTNINLEKAWMQLPEKLRNSSPSFAPGASVGKTQEPTSSQSQESSRPSSNPFGSQGPTSPFDPAVPVSFAPGADVRSSSSGAKSSPFAPSASIVAPGAQAYFPDATAAAFTGTFQPVQIAENDPSDLKAYMLGAGISFSKEFALLDSVRRAIIMVTGLEWRPTSWMRNSPGHITGLSLDIAPVITDANKDSYAVTHMRDPLLNLRKEPFMALFRWQREVNVTGDPRLPTKFDVGIFIESDHLHIQLYTKGVLGNRLDVERFLVPKGDSVYKNSTADFNAAWSMFVKTKDRSTGRYVGLSADDIRKVRRS